MSDVAPGATGAREFLNPSAAQPPAPPPVAPPPGAGVVSSAPQNVGHTAVAAAGIILLWLLSLVHLTPPPEVAVSFVTLAGVGVTYLMQRRGH
jgi:hypothetical protein